MKLLDRIIPVLSRVPNIVQDVEKTHHGKSGEEKHAAAMDLVKEGLGAADAATPEHAEQINAVAQQIGGLGIRSRSTSVPEGSATSLAWN